MNPLEALNLATHDDGVAAICGFSVAADWLAIALPATHRRSPPSRSRTAASATLSPQPQSQPSMQTQTAGTGTAPPPYRLPLAQPGHSILPLTPTHLHTSPTPPSPANAVAASPAFVFGPPLASGFGLAPAEAITKRQATAALVRHVRPYARREVLAPCFGIGQRFILGRLLGTLHIPEELGLTHLDSEKCADARFVLDLRFGSLVEVRHYATSNIVLCVAYAAKRAEFVAVPPSHYARVEITYRRDVSASHMDVPVSRSQDIRLQTTPTDIDPGRPRLHHDPQLQLASPHLALGQHFQQMHFHQQQGQLEHQQEELNIGRHELEAHGQHRQWSWHDFCINYGSFFPTGPLIATITSEPGSSSAVMRKESIIVTVNDGYAMTFCISNVPRGGSVQARRIAPKRLLPRPAP